mmetsp:Transcript_27934/g.89153  ORF Transcript_27934/g.89153 Transcript_27934/m.89153 type:complete len:144 (-) Transcript_27934:216-647(-)|eukprot:CAMPEP_0182913672 /NCGR_PEP_ID=MMETSP0034_2-20130328/38160_1 /TAXON_ID=156128 /ORGANISM="Nephroselmis pyriformis, Strain CCMP717" /LENGTH=143 /DNA_ID=CAMNT_0025050399 /DNA_START=46 /DNA_END=477 /DNA_ORIENTATION=-
MATTLKSLAAFLPDDPVVYGLFIGAALLVIVVLLVQTPEGKKGGRKGTVTKKEGGKDVRRSTRSVHAPERWDPDTPGSPTGMASPPTKLTRRTPAKVEPASPGPASPRGRAASRKTPSKSRGVSKSPSPPPAQRTRAKTPAKK